MVRTRGDPGPAPIEADPSQIEQVIVVLVGQWARDAMPGGGKTRRRNQTRGDSARTLSTTRPSSASP